MPCRCNQSRDAEASARNPRPRAASPVRSRSARCSSAVTPRSASSRCARRRPRTSTRPCSRSPSSRHPAATSCASPFRAGRRGCAAHHREEEPDPGDRRHPLPAEVRVPGDRRRVRRPCASTRATSASSTTRWARSPRRRRPRASASASASTPDRSSRSLLQKYGKATPEALVESAVWEASLFEEHDFHDFKISVKHNDPIDHGARRTACSPSAATGRCTSA